MSILGAYRSAATIVGSAPLARRAPSIPDQRCLWTSVYSNRAFQLVFQIKPWHPSQGLKGPKARRGAARHVPGLAAAGAVTEVFSCGPSALAHPALRPLRRSARHAESGRDPRANSSPSHLHRCFRWKSINNASERCVITGTLGKTQVRCPLKIGANRVRGLGLTERSPYALVPSGARL